MTHLIELDLELKTLLAIQNLTRDGNMINLKQMPLVHQKSCLIMFHKHMLCTVNFLYETL